jgi:hypothetical protein
MTAKTQTPANYTAEQTAMMVERYLAAPVRETAEVLAQELGKTLRSVTAKLSREGVYKAQTYVSKTGAAVASKDKTADAIGAILTARNIGLSESETESLTKANKTALVKILQALGG